MPISRRNHRPSNFSETVEGGKESLPTPSHRHAAPSAPWPWIDTRDPIDARQLECEAPPVPEPCDHTTCAQTGGCWKGYPQSRFPNWTPSQIASSKIADAISNYDKSAPCKIYHVDVDDRGFFTSANELVAQENAETLWEIMIHIQRPNNIRVRALFVENMSGPVLQMLGAKYNIEPFFFSSSINWIPSRFQENPIPGKGDHITITLTFLKSIKKIDDKTGSISSKASVNTTEDRPTPTEQMIDTQSPLQLKSPLRCQSLVLDLLSVHLIRNVEGSTIISFHPNMDHPVTTAKWLRDRIRYAGQSVYWQRIFQKCPDPTFVLLTFVWHAVYAWDEALEDLYIHICWLETRVIETSNVALTRELHVIRAHHLHYSSLLENFEKTVKFIKTTHYPGLPKTGLGYSATLMDRECDNLLSEIHRLEMGRKMHDKRLKNVMNLVFSSVNIEDSKSMQQMTQVAVKDSAAMKQIAYLTMIFLPSSLVAAVFGMNIKEIVPNSHGSLPHYFAVALPLTAITVWVIMAFQTRSKELYPKGTPLWKRLSWPVTLYETRFGKRSEEIPLPTQVQQE